MRRPRLTGRAALIGRLGAFRARHGLYWPRHPASGWRPPELPSHLGDFIMSPPDAALDEGCRRLAVVRDGAVLHGDFRRNAGTRVVRRQDGETCWLKLSGLRGDAAHPYYGGELAAAAVAAVPKPAILDKAEWNDGDVRWRALLMTYVASPSVESHFWAGRNAARVTDAWLAGLARALRELAPVETDRLARSPEEIAKAIRGCFGSGAPADAEKWTAAHGSLHWSHLTAPSLSILDWESWGRAPRGFDAAWLIASSCCDRRLVSRLEEVFAEDLNGRSGLVARLAAVAELWLGVKYRWISPVFAGPLDEMATRLRRAW